MKYGIPVKGTQAHAFVTSYTSTEDSLVGKLQPSDPLKPPEDLYPLVTQWLKKVAPVLHVLEDEVNVGELVAFAAYAQAFPNGFLALIDTFDVVRLVKSILNSVAYYIHVCL